MKAGRLFATLVLVAVARPAFSHPAPFSYVDVRLQQGRLEASVVAHAIDVAHELGVASPDRVLDRAFAEAQKDRIFTLIRERLTLAPDGMVAAPELAGLDVLPERQAVRLHLRFPGTFAPGAIHVRAALFPYDPNHQTFLNVYEDGALAHQSIFDRGRTAFEYFPGTRQGALAVVRKFVAAGVHHIVIGPDHVLFLVGLLLLGGGTLQLLKIVTAFTIAHSITLSLAALDVLNPSGRIVEPAIALSIVYVGADNLLVTKEGRDVRAWIALGFGLMHGFGFASVLKELDLPRQALGWSLFSFNVGVEIGQVCIVAAVASLLAAIRRRDALLGRRIASAGSVTVIVAGAYWFVGRVF